MSCAMDECIVSEHGCIDIMGSVRLFFVNVGSEIFLKN